MSSISNDKKTALCIAGIVLLVIGAVLALTVGQDYQDRKTAITNLYDQCMSDSLTSAVSISSSDKEAFCQCRAETMHDAGMRLMDTLEVAGEYGLMESADYTGITTDSEGLANVGSYYYCAAKVREED